MNTSSTRSHFRGEAFTLIELLVVIAIIGILAGLLLPALVVAQNNAKKKLSQADMVSIIAAISQYKADYSIMPASTNAVAAALTANKVNNDFTFGTVITANTGWPGGPEIVPGLSQQVITPDTIDYQNANSEVVSILRDDGNYPETIGAASHLYNPKKNIYFNPSKIAASTNAAGVDPYSIYRDPWGNPYMMTLDMNGDGKCYDQTWYLLEGTGFSVPGDAMIWSFGQYGPSRFKTDPADVATTLQNVVTSWK